MDAFENFMSTVTDTIMQQVLEQVKMAVEVASSARPLHHFKYVPTAGLEPFHGHDPMMSHRHSERMRETPHANRNSRLREENQDHYIGANTPPSHRPSHRQLAKSTMALTLCATHSR